MVSTAPTQQDIQNLAWTMLGEAYPGDTAGMSAVGNTVLNRLNSGGYGSTISQVVLAPNQYAAWGIGSQATAQGSNPQGRFPVGSPQFQQALGLAQQLLNGTVPDNTGGAVNYRQTTPGTRWAEGSPGTISVGGNTFQTGRAGSIAAPRPALPLPNSSGSPDDRSHVQLPDSGFRLTNGQGGPNGLVAADFHSMPPPPRPDPRTGLPSFSIPALPSAAVPTTPPGYNTVTDAQRTAMAQLPPPPPIPATRPPGLGAPPPPPPQMATTSTGKTIQVGKNYDIGGKQYIGGVNAQGVGTLTKVTSPLSQAAPGTIAGGIVGKALGGALSTAGTNLQNAAGVAGQDITGGLTNVRNAVAGGAQNAVSGVGNFLSGIFGSGGNSAQPVVAPNSSGSPDDRGTAPASFIPPRPTPAPWPTYTPTPQAATGNTIPSPPPAVPPNSSGSPDDRSSPSIWNAPNISPGNLMDPRLAAISPANLPSMAPPSSPYSPPRSYVPAPNSSGSPDDRNVNPPAPPSIWANTTSQPIPAPWNTNFTPQSIAGPTTQSVQVANPAYRTWVESYGDAAQAAARTANPMGGPNGLSAADFAPPSIVPPAPPQTVTIRRPVASPSSPSQTSSPPPAQQVRLASGSMANVGQQFTANGYRYQVNANGSTTNLDTGHTYGTPTPSYSPTYSYATPGGPNGLSASQFPQPAAGGLQGFWNSTPAGHIVNFLTGNAGASTGGLGGGLLNGLTGMFQGGHSSLYPPGTNLATLGNENTASVDSHGSSGEASTNGPNGNSTQAQLDRAMAYNASHPGVVGEWMMGMPLEWRNTVNPAVPRTLPGYPAPSSVPVIPASSPPPIPQSQPSAPVISPPRFNGPPPGAGGPQVPGSDGAGWRWGNGAPQSSGGPPWGQGNPSNGSSNPDMLQKIMARMANQPGGYQ